MPPCEFLYSQEPTPPNCMPLAQGKGVQEAMGRRVAVIGREKLMKLAGVGELAVVEKAVAAAVAANVQVRVDHKKDHQYDC